MSNVPQSSAPVPRLVIAGLLLAALDHLRRLQLPHPAAADVLAATGAGRTRAYEYREMILEHLPELERPVGRPRAPSPEPPTDTSALSREVLGFLKRHPGSAVEKPERASYADAFRAFVLDLRERHKDIDLRTFAAAIDVPLGTVEDWLRPKPGGQELELPAPRSVATIPQIETIVDAWRQFRGTFADFVRHVQDNLRIPYGRTWISSVLESQGARRPRRRRGPGPDAEAIRGDFETFFPGAQWIGDGMQLSVRINDDVITGNLELAVDAHSGAFVGASVRDAEDSAAVVEAFEDGVQTTGAPPLGLLLDNRPSNHTQDVDAALGDTIRLRATPGRAQNKAHVEGAFGLFQQTAPPLEIDAPTPKELGHKILTLLVLVWARATNHFPRRDRHGRSRVQIYAEDKPTPEQIAEAKKALRERHRKQELYEQRRRARQDPVVRAMLDAAFLRLDLADPDGHLRAAIATYSLDDVLAGIATFEGKRTAGTLPPGVGARYLLGIIRNIAAQREGLAIAQALLRARLDARDRALEPLRAELDLLLQERTNPLRVLVDRAMAAARFIDRLFWLEAAADTICRRQPAEHPSLLRDAARRIHATFRVPYTQRLFAVRYLAERVLPLDSAA